MNLNEEMIAQLRLLLQTIAQRAQWGLDRVAGAPSESEQKLSADQTSSLSSKVLH